MWFVRVSWEQHFHPCRPGACCWADGNPLWEQATAGLYLFSPSQKRQWDGHKGPVWVKREIDCQSKSVSWQKWEWHIQNVLTRLCWWLFVWTELTFFVLLLTRSYCMTFIEQWSQSALFFCSFPDELPRARAISGIKLGAWAGSCHNPHPTISEINIHRGVHLTYLKKENNQEWGFLLKTPQNYFSTALFSFKPVQVQKGSA